MTMQASDLVLRFVSSVGAPKEAQFYLSLFRAERPESFAVIAVAEAVMRDAAGALVVDLRFLARLGLTPVILLGQLGAAGPGDAAAHAAYLARHLRPDVRAEIATAQNARELCRAGVIPLIPIEAAAGGPKRGDARPDVRGDARPEDGVDALAQLATSLATRKVIFLGRQSGLSPHGGATLSLVDLTTEYESLMQVLPADDAALLRLTRRLVDAVPHRLTIAVTSPLDLLRELFTTRGAGTLIRRGSVVVRHPGYQDLSLERVRDLLEAAFHRRLIAGFFDRPVSAVYVADDYRGVAIVTTTPQGPYLSKFAVDRRAQGEGVGRDLWRAMVRDHDTLLWRSRADNPIISWYEQHCDGMMRAGAWRVFWRGLSPACLPGAIELAAAAPPDFQDPSHSNPEAT